MNEEILFSKREFYWRTVGHYWRVHARMEGMDGAGGATITELWRWPDGRRCREQARNLTRAETAQMLKEIRR